jgi:ABC-type Fe3+ transport system permease subunit
MILKKTVLLLCLLLLPAFHVLAQTDDSQATPAFDTTGFPQWAKDFRRWDIVAFGSFPFTMLFTTTIMDMYRWNNYNGMSFSDEGRRYAPWPLKTAGAVAMTRSEMVRTIQIAAISSVTIAFLDLLIVKAKRRKAQRMAESVPTGTTIITRTPLPEEPSDEEEALTEPDTGEAPP